MCVQLFVTPWTIAYQAPLSMGFSRQEYLSGLSFPSPGDLPDPGIEPKSPAFAGEFFTTSTTKLLFPSTNTPSGVSDFLKHKSVTLLPN